jgi:glycosyltransferase involved in cell wall biosynthesis
MAGSTELGPAGSPAPPALSVVLCTHNGSRWIEQQLAALAAQSTRHRWELVVVDNDSTDDTVEVVERFRSQLSGLRVVAAPEQRNLAYARNVGVAAADGRAVAFVDDDDEVAPGWVDAMASALQESPVVASRLDYRSLNGPAARRAMPREESDNLGRMFGLPALGGGAAGFQRWVWEELGGTDPSWDRTGEDFDLSFRMALQLELEPVLVEDAVCRIRLRGDARSGFRQMRRYGASHVRLWRIYGRPRGYDREPLGGVLRQWGWLLAHLPDLRDPARRSRWARLAGRRVGRLEGSIRERTVYW